MTTRPAYDCDTHPYWCSQEDFDNRDRHFGAFVDEGRGYRIYDPDTPRPWLNYFANHKFGSVMCNQGRGFTWYRSTLLRLTKYEHPIDYLPREFVDGREIILTDLASNVTVNVLREADDIVCVHRPGYSTITANILDVRVEFTLFVPLEDSCEIWCIKLSHSGSESRNLSVKLEQTWSLAMFGIHTAEKGIPYLSTPGRGLEVRAEDLGVYAHSTNDELPYELFGIFQSVQAESSGVSAVCADPSDPAAHVFHQAQLSTRLRLGEGECLRIDVISGVEISQDAALALREKYVHPNAAAEEFTKMQEQWGAWLRQPACDLPDKNLEYFLNTWLKNQIHLTFRFVRSGQNGYRDTLQDTWGYVLIDPVQARERLLEILAHQLPDGTAPRQFSRFGDGKHDMRRFMDSSVWIPRALVDWVKETGDLTLLNKPVAFLNGDVASVDEHVWRALDYLYQHRGLHGACLTGDGDWNDALEGISKDGDAVSVWLTMALYDAMQAMIELYTEAGRTERVHCLLERAAELKRVVNEEAWDGAWYTYGFTGSGKPIGSKLNREGRIHLNAQTWAVFSGLADSERAAQAMQSVSKHLDTPLGPVLMSPAYVNEGDEVGRIANLEPGTFENASIYQHAVTFKIFAELAMGKGNEGYQSFAKMLPTNPDNPDTRRTSEPYCTGNYYCGPDHPRFGQNFFTWFTGNPSWLLRAGFDEMLGVKAGFNGLVICPTVPDEWTHFTVRRRYRNCDYTIFFQRGDAGLQIRVDGESVQGAVVPIQHTPACHVHVLF